MPLVAYAKRLGTDFRLVHKDPIVKTARCLIAAPAPHEGPWAVRKQEHTYDYHGGVSGLDPFRNMARLSDWWNGYKDYTLSREEAVDRLLRFESDYPEIDENWERDVRIPHVLTAVPGPWNRYPR